MESPKRKLGILSLQFYCYPDEVGGAWKFTYEVNRRLAQRGHQVFLITCKPDETFPDEEVIDGVHYFRIGVRESKSVVGLFWSLRKLVHAILEKHPIHLVHAHNPLVQFLALAIPQLWRIPRVYHFFSLWYDEERINRRGERETTEKHPWTFRLKLEILARIIQFVEWTCFRAAQEILFLSEYTQKRFFEFYPWKKPRLKMIPGGVDVEQFRPTGPGEVLECRRRFGLPLNDPIFLTVRRLEARMGLENLIDACAIVARKDPDLKFHMLIVGKGSWRERLRSQIQNLGLEEKVRLTGPVSAEDLPLYYRASDIFILPTTAIEGFGLVTVEALASGVPVIGTPVGATVEILRGVDPNLLFEGTTPEAMARKMEEYLKNPAPLHALKERCREEAIQKYGWDPVARAIEEEFFRITEIWPERYI